MNSVAVPTGTRPRFFGSPGGRGRWFEGIGVTGFAIAAAATLLLALNSTSRVLGVRRCSRPANARCKWSTAW